MAVIVLNRFKGTQDYKAAGTQLASFFKRHGATGVRAGRIYSGAHAGQLVVATSYSDMAAFGRTAQALLSDGEFLKLYGEFTKAYELQERSVNVVEDF